MILSEILKLLDKGVLQSCCDKGQGKFGGKAIEEWFENGFPSLVKYHGT